MTPLAAVLKFPQPMRMSLLVESPTWLKTRPGQSAAHAAKRRHAAFAVRPRDWCLWDERRLDVRAPLDGALTPAC